MIKVIVYAFPREKTFHFYLRKSPLLLCDFWVASGTWRNVITCTYLFGVSCRARGLNSNTFLYSSDCFVRRRKNSLPVSVVFGIECVRLTSSNSQIQNKTATKGFILIRHKRYQIYTCFQLSSSIAFFVWKPVHFELRSYGGAWHNTKIAFVEKYTLISWFLAI